MWHLHLDVWVSALCKEYMSVSVKAFVHIAGLQGMENVTAGDCISSCGRHVASADGGMWMPVAAQHDSQHLQTQAAQFLRESAIIFMALPSTINSV